MAAWDLRAEAAEAVGVFFLVLLGGAAILGDAAGGPLGVSLAFGFTVLVLVYALGPISGAHYNPAITLAFAATRHFPWRRVPTYILAQTLGATGAALVLLALFGDVRAATTTPSTSLPAAFAWEALATSFLALVIIGVATDRRTSPASAGLAIGLAVAVGALVAGPLTGGSMNPARSLGPALAAGDLGHLWLYVTAPPVGAVAAMMLFEALRPGRAPGTALGATGPLSLGGEEKA
jgi:aquaporin NIP